MDIIQRASQAAQTALHRFIEAVPVPEVLRALLDEIVAITESGYGFIAEASPPEGGPAFRVHAIGPGLEGDAIRSYYEGQASLRDDLSDREGPIISDGPGTDPRKGGIPPDHPEPTTLAVIPVRQSGRLVGAIGLGSRPGGYDAVRLEALEPVRSACALLLTAEGTARGGGLRPEEEFGRFFDISLNLLCVAGFDGYFKQLNPSWERNLGFTIDELLARPFVEFVHPSDRENTARAAAGLGEGEDVVSFENRYIGKDGAYRWLLWTATADLANQRIYASAVNVTERHRAEAKEREVVSRIRSILDTVVDGIITIDEQGIVEGFNPAATGIFGYEPEEVIGKNVRMLMPEPYHGEHDGHLRRYRETGRPHIIGSRREVVGRRKDGSVFPMDLSVGEMEVDGARIFTGIVRDVTERKAIERMKNEFISTVSHELRTPLTSIRGSLRLIEGGVVGEIPDQAMDLVRVAGSNTERLVRLINDILDLEKIEAGRLELEQKDIEPGRLVETTLEGVRGMASEAGVELVAEIGTERGLFADEDRLVQVLTNLLSNAIKFSSRGGKVVVRVEERDDRRLRFSVEDHGPGIPAEQVGKLFGKFQQLDASDARKRGGSGLGLAISKAIVEEHGGAIGVESDPGVRTTFWFDLDPVGMPGRAADLPGDGDGRRYSVLIVEDDHATAEILALMLRRDGFRSEQAGSLADARERLRHRVPDAILLDLRLHDGSGLDLLMQIRTDERTSDTPVIIVTGSETRPEGFGHPLIVDWLPKPVDDRRLGEALRRAVRRPGRPRVLLVEDDASARKVMAAQLEGLGVDVTEAESGAEAIDKARTHDPDLVVLDVGLPGKDGFDVVAALRKEKARVMPVLVYTGRELDTTERSALRLGMTEYLTKSRASEEEFVASVRDLLKRAIGDDSRPGPHPGPDPV